MEMAPSIKKFMAKIIFNLNLKLEDGETFSKFSFNIYFDLNLVES